MPAGLASPYKAGTMYLRCGLGVPDTSGFDAFGRRVLRCVFSPLPCMVSAECPGAVCRAWQSTAVVPDAAPGPGQEGDPHEESTFSEPQDRPQGDVRGSRQCPEAKAANTGDSDGGNRRRGKDSGFPADKEDSARQDGQLDGQAARLGPVVICLPQPLPPELTAGRRHPPDHDVGPIGDEISGGLSRPDHLKVLEQHVGVPAAHRLDGARPDCERAGPVRANGSGQKGASGVPAGVPRPSGERVLGSNNVREFQGPHQGSDGLPVVANVVVGEHDEFVATGIDPSESTQHLAVQALTARRHDAYSRRDGGTVPTGFRGFGAIHHGDVGQLHQALEVGSQLRQPAIVAPRSRGVTRMPGLPAQRDNHLHGEPAGDVCAGNLALRGLPGAEPVVTRSAGHIWALPGHNVGR